MPENTPAFGSPAQRVERRLLQQGKIGAWHRRLLQGAAVGGIQPQQLTNVPAAQVIRLQKLVQAFGLFRNHLQGGLDVDALLGKAIKNCLAICDGQVLGCRSFSPNLVDGHVGILELKACTFENLAPRPVARDMKILPQFINQLRRTVAVPVNGKPPPVGQHALAQGVNRAQVHQA